MCVMLANQSLSAKGLGGSMEKILVKYGKDFG